jgi:hypothetical protein
MHLHHGAQATQPLLSSSAVRWACSADSLRSDHCYRCRIVATRTSVKVCHVQRGAETHTQTKSEGVEGRPVESPP